jgi:hypothetical protein
VPPEIAGGFRRPPRRLHCVPGSSSRPSFSHRRFKPDGKRILKNDGLMDLNRLH